MEGIKNLLKRRNISGYKKNIEIDEKTIAAIFLDVAAKEIRHFSSEDIWEIYLKNKILYVKAVHPAVACEIWRKRENIKKKINDITGREFIEEIKIKQR